jgi:D-alanyl-D-alanine carboxypeptidase/D-alanyl-D-alanine-endopeptidase (penicillin-binding protein 4)
VPLSTLEVAHLEHVMAKAMKPLGAHSSAYAVDLANGDVLYDAGATIPRNPASVEKLYTLTSVLAYFGTDGTLSTQVYTTGSVDSHGVLHGDLYLRGGGDPTFGDAAFIRANYGGIGTTVGTVARRVIAALHLRRVDGSVIGDESAFDSLRGGPASGYALDSNLVGELSALAFDRGESGDLRSPPAYAAYRLAASLRADGVVVTGRSHAGALTAGTGQLATSVASPTMAQLAGLTARPSDDFFAEMLLKALGARFGGAGTTAAGAAVVERYVGRLHLRPTILDGSGLSRGDRTTPLDVVTLLRDLSPGGIPSLQTIGEVLRESLPVAARSGTLELRMHHTAAAGNCIAKTGTLSDASDLAGWCDGSFVFAFLMNHVNVTAAQNAEDSMTVALAKIATAPATRPRRAG